MKKVICKINPESEIKIHENYLRWCLFLLSTACNFNRTWASPPVFLKIKKKNGLKFPVKDLCEQVIPKLQNWQTKKQKKTQNTWWDKLGVWEKTSGMKWVKYSLALLFSNWETQFDEILGSGFIAYFEQILRYISEKYKFKVINKNTRFLCWFSFLLI